MPPPGKTNVPQEGRGHWRGWRCWKDVTTTSSFLFLLLLSVFLLLSSFATPVTSSGDPDLDLRRELNDAMVAVQACRAYSNPAMAVTVVKDGQVLLSAGYGRTAISGPREDVNQTTRFNIASLSKAFAATLLLKVMEEDGRYNLSSKVRDILDGQLHFGDEVRTQEATVEDLLSHKMAIPANNRMRFNTNITRANVKDRIRYLKTPDLFRNIYIYSNLMYGMATYLAEVIGGKPWETLVREHIYQPLRMTRSTFVKDALSDTHRFARPYKYYFGNLRRVNPGLPYHWSEMAGSGSVVTTADDMVKWLNFHLSKGLGPEGKRVMPQDTVEELYKPRTGMDKPTMTKFRRPSVPVTFTYDVYSMGFRRGYYRGYPIVGHGGSSFGYRSLLTLVPSQNVGVFTVMSGGDTSYRLRGTLHAYLMDRALNTSSWLDVNTMCSFPEPWYNDTSKTWPPYDTSKRLAHNVSAYVGLYENPAYGTFEVREWRDSGVSDDGKEPEARLTLFFGFATWDLVPLSSEESSSSDRSKEAFYGKGRNVTAWVDYSPFEFYAPPKGSDVIVKMTAKGLEKRAPPVFVRVGTAMSGSWRLCGFSGLVLVVAFLFVDF